MWQAEAQKSGSGTETENVRKYRNNYKECMKPKRSDEGYERSNISSQLYNFLAPSDREIAKNKVVRKRLNPAEAKFKLHPRKMRKQKQKEYKEYNPDCECCQVNYILIHIC